MIDFNELKKKRVDSLGLPDWLIMDCRSCGGRMELHSILSMGIEMSPKTFGNVSISYLCPHCSSLVEMHYVKAMVESFNLAEFLSQEHRPSEPIPFDQVVISKEHNLL